jgi:hypothetical protein
VGPTLTCGSHADPRVPHVSKHGTDGKLDRMVKVRRVGHPSSKTEEVLILGVELIRVTRGEM